MRVLATGGGAVAPEPRMRSDDKRLHLKGHLRIVELATTKAERVHSCTHVAISRTHVA